MSPPVSAFAGYEDGVIDMGLTAFEKRGIAVTTPMWRADACIQCNRCAFVCPHAAIRPYLVSEEEAAAAPAGFETVALKGGKNLPDGMRFTLQVSHLDCTSCGSCADVCPAGALAMEPAKFTDESRTLWEYGLGLAEKGSVFDPYSVKGTAVQTAPPRVLGSMCRMRRDALRKAAHPAVRRPRILGKRHGLLAGVGFALPRHPLYHQQARLRPGMDQQPFREQRRTFVRSLLGNRLSSARPRSRASRSSCRCSHAVWRT